MRRRLANGDEAVIVLFAPPLLAAQIRGSAPIVCAWSGDRCMQEAVARWLLRPTRLTATTARIRRSGRRRACRYSGHAIPFGGVLDGPVPVCRSRCSSRPASGCGGAKATEASNPTPSTLIVVQGTNQAVQAGKELPNAIVLRVLTEDGKPVEKTTVGFTVATGGGSVNPGSVLTDANGEARTKWVLGPTTPEQSLKAEVAGIDPVTIVATAIVPTDVVIAQGNNQSAQVSGCARQRDRDSRCGHQQHADRRRAGRVSDHGWRGRDHAAVGADEHVRRSEREVDDGPGRRLQYLDCNGCQSGAGSHSRRRRRRRVGENGNRERERERGTGNREPDREPGTGNDAKDRGHSEPSGEESRPSRRRA